MAATATAKSSKAAAAKAKVQGKQSAAKATTKTAAKAKPAKTDEPEGPSKRELQRAKDAELRAQVVEMRENDEKWADIAAELSITSGKAQFLMMQHDVEQGTVPAIRFRNDDELVERVRKAREANDQFSSWGYIAARTGVSEGRIKALAEAAGMDVKGTNVAVARKQATGTNGSTKTGGGKAAAKPAAKAKDSGSAKAKARAAKAAKSRPTSQG